MKKPGCLLIVLILFSRIGAQTLSPQVTTGGGASFSNSAGSLSITFGEMSTTTLVAGLNILTQGFQQAQPNVALPVILLSFTAKLINTQTHLEWKTSQEINSSHFEVQRSPNGINFSPLLNLPAQGNSNIPHTYNAIDPSPFAGNTFYRLKQVDIDGRFAYSPVVVVKLEEEIVLSVYPNPAHHRVSIQLTTGKQQDVAFEILNVTGQVMQSRTEKLQTGVNHFEWDISALANGMYLIRTKNIDLPVIRIIKQ